LTTSEVRVDVPSGRRFSRFWHNTGTGRLYPWGLKQRNIAANRGNSHRRTVYKARPEICPPDYWCDLFARRPLDSPKPAEHYLLRRRYRSASSNLPSCFESLPAIQTGSVIEQSGDPTAGARQRLGHGRGLASPQELALQSWGALPFVEQLPVGANRLKPHMISCCLVPGNNQHLIPCQLLPAEGCARPTGRSRIQLALAMRTTVRQPMQNLAGDSATIRRKMPNQPKSL